MDEAKRGGDGRRAPDRPGHTRTSPLSWLSHLDITANTLVVISVADLFWLSSHMATTRKGLLALVARPAIDLQMRFGQGGVSNYKDMW